MDAVGGSEKARVDWHMRSVEPANIRIKLSIKDIISVTSRQGTSMRTLAMFRIKPDYQSFCFPEAKALLKLFNKPDLVEVFPDDLTPHAQLVQDKPYLVNDSLFPNFPLVYTNIDNETALKIHSRSVVIKRFFNIYADGKDYEELNSNILKNIELLRPEMDSEQTLAMKVETINFSIS